MPTNITQYGVFIGTPGGLEKERRAFKTAIEQFNRIHKDAESSFASVGWEDTLAGIGRPQEKINQDLRHCDYAVFAFHDRWGSSSSTSGSMVGTEEEFLLAEELYSQGSIRNIILLFKDVSAAQLKDPGEQLKKVLAFKDKIISEKKYLFKPFKSLNSFSYEVSCQLGSWMIEHSKGNSSVDLSQDLDAVEGGAVESFDGLSLKDGKRPTSESAKAISYHEWMRVAEYIADLDRVDHSTVAALSKYAVDAAEGDMQRAAALSLLGLSRHAMQEAPAAISAFDEIVSLAKRQAEGGNHELEANALLAKAITIRDLGRYQDANDLFDRAIEVLGNIPAVGTEATVAQIMLSKGVARARSRDFLGAIAIYDSIIEKFSSNIQPDVIVKVVAARVNRAINLGKIGERSSELEEYDRVIDKYSAIDNELVKDQVSKSILNKGVLTSRSGDQNGAISLYDLTIERLRNESSVKLRSRFSSALYNKGLALCRMHRESDAIFLFDEALNALSGLSDETARNKTPKYKLAKARALASLNKKDEAIGLIDEALAITESDSAEGAEIALQLLSSKGAVLASMGKADESLQVYESAEIISDRSYPSISGRAQILLSVGKIASLALLGRNKDAKAEYHSLIQKHGESVHEVAPKLKEMVLSLSKKTKK